MKNLRVCCSILVFLLLSIPVWSDQPSDWAEEEVDEAVSLGLIPEDLQDCYTSPAIREDFAKIALSVCVTVNNKEDTDELLFARRETLRDGPAFLDVSGKWADSVKAAYRLGIINGRSDTVFDPDSSVTREEAAAMLGRVWTVCGGECVGGTLDYRDRDDIADWARESVACLTELDVFRGMGDGTFAPRGTYTREQCILTALRLYRVLTAEAEPTAEFEREEEAESAFPTKEAIRTDYFSYSLNQDGSLTVLRYLGPNGIIVMQPTLDGHAVTAIAPGTFDGYPGLKVCAPDSIAKIGEGAFPAEIGGVYYESEQGEAKAYAQAHRLPAALWDWEEIAFIPWVYRPLDAGPNHEGAPINSAIAQTAVTQIFCERSPAEKFHYIVEDGGITITGYEGEETPAYADDYVPLYVSIPREIDGLPVRKLAAGCFFSAMLQHLEIPGTVRRIGSYVCGSRAEVLTVHVLDGEDFTIGRNVFTSVNHVRFHNNLRGFDDSDYDEAYELPSRTEILMHCALVPEDFSEVNGWTPIAFTYPENEG